MAVYRNRGREAAERLIKLRDYLYMNATPTHAVKMAEILAYLASEGHEVEIKTVYRDLDTLKDFFHLDIDYDGRQRGYILKNPKFEPHELRMIVNSIQAAKFVTQEEADRLTNKIMNNLADKYTRPSLKRETYIPNRVRSINEEAMKGLDIIYDAIAQNRKISYKYFQYVLTGHNKVKEYQTIDNSKILTASPYRVLWQNNKYWIQAIQKIPKEMYFQYMEHDDDECADDFEFEDMDDTGLYVYDLCTLELGLMEQIKLLPENREGKVIAQRWLDSLDKAPKTSIGKTKLKVNNMYLSDVIDKFGHEVSMFAEGHTFFIATINEEPTPELYLWTREFVPPIEIIYPENVEGELRAYLSRLSKWDGSDIQVLKDMYQAEEEFLSLQHNKR